MFVNFVRHKGISISYIYIYIFFYIKLFYTSYSIYCSVQSPSPVNSLQKILPSGNKCHSNHFLIWFENGLIINEFFLTVIFWINVFGNLEKALKISFSEVIGFSFAPNLKFLFPAPKCPSTSEWLEKVQKNSNKYLL